MLRCKSSFESSGLSADLNVAQQPLDVGMISLRRMSFDSFVIHYYGKSHKIAVISFFAGTKRLRLFQLSAIVTAFSIQFYYFGGKAEGCVENTC